MSKSSRQTILRAFRAQGKCTVRDLADAAGISPVSVRHHLANLQAEGLVATEEVRHGVGRPRLLYSLTERALDMFPTRYFQLTSRLLGEIKDSFSAETLERIFTGVASSMADAYAAELRGLPLEQRLERLIQSLTSEGFEAELEERPDDLLIHELSCPYFRMGQEYPEVCLVDEHFITRSLALPVERVTCMLDGHAHCTFAVSRQPSPSEALPG
jgi:DeoR family suf operon transcriptional repressor